MSELEPLGQNCVVQASVAVRSSPAGEIDRSPLEITFVRSRMLYAKAALTASGAVQCGFRHIRKLSD